MASPAKLMSPEPFWTRRAGNYLLWTLQVVLALLFLFSGSMKFVMTVAQMTQQLALPGWFLHFIGAAEIVGAFGLVLPWALRIRPALTPLAAACLLIIVTGATVLTLKTGPAVVAVLPFVTAILLAIVVYGRFVARRPSAAAVSD